MQRLFPLIIGFFFIANTFAQEEKLEIVDIRFKGNTKTKTEYLERFTQCEKGEIPDSSMMQEDIRLLRSLSGVLDAHCEFDTTEDGLILNYRIEERYTLLPLADFGLTNDGYWFGLGAFDANLGGKGIYLYGFYRYYERHSLQIYFRIPYLFNSKWGLDISTSKWATVEPLFMGESTATYNYDYYTAEMLARYEIKLEHELRIGGGVLYEYYERLEYDDAFPWPESVDKPKTVIKVNHQIRKFDYHYFYIKGFSNETRFETVLSNNGAEAPFLLFQNDFRYFRRFGSRINVGMRNIIGLASNRLSPFSPFVLDSYQNIRGVGERVDRGTGTFILNLEYRHTLYENNLGGIQGVAFADFGSWRKPGGSFNDFTMNHNIKRFGGLGIRLIYKKAFGAILSIDYGFDMQDPSVGGWVLGVGQYF